MNDNSTDLKIAKERVSKLLVEAFDECETWVTDKGGNVLIMHVKKMIFINGEWQGIYANRLVFISELQLKHDEFFNDSMSSAINAVKNQISELIRDKKSKVRFNNQD